MTTSQFMDKQIMDLSSHSANDFIDLMNPQDDHQIRGSDKKEEILPSYDFQPIRPIGVSSSPTKLDTGGVRSWSSSDNKTSAASIRNYSSLDSFEPAKVVTEKDRAIDPTLVSEIDRTMKKYADNLLHAMDAVSARLSQLESRTRHLENSVDDLKVAVGNNHGNSDGRMRQLENILREVQNGVQVIKDKQEIMDAHFQLAKLQVSKVEQHADAQSFEHVDSSQSAIPASQPSHQQHPSGALVQPPPTLLPPNAPPSPNAPPPPPSQQNILSMGQQPNQYSQIQMPPLPQREQYYPPPGQAPENLGQPFQIPPQQLQAPSPTPTPSQQQYQPPPPPQNSQPPAPTQQPIPPAVNPLAPPSLGHHPEEPPYLQSQSYPPPDIRQPPSHPPGGAPPPPQYYGASPPNTYEPTSSRPGPGFPTSYGPSHGSGEPYSYSSSSQYGGGSPMKQQQLSSPAISHSGGSGYPQLPTARLLPHALPTASGVGGGGGSPSAGSGNKVPIEDVVDKVTNMGFPRDQVRATVRRLTENGQAVDLNVVLDKLMNDGGSWYNR